MDKESWGSTIQETLISLLDEKNYNKDVAEGKGECRYIFIKVGTMRAECCCIRD
jgi:hypothetical protein